MKKKDIEDHECVHCGLTATVRILLQDGCFARPKDRAQWLCEYHYERKSPRMGWWLMEDLIDEPK